MARLGELLVDAGLLTSEQLDRALRAQVMWGARLGTNLVELGLIDLDVLSTFLGRQHNMPAALARHFEKVDRELQLLLSADLAEMFCCVPLVRTGPRRDIVVAASSPLTKKAVGRIADDLAVEVDQLIISMAAELRIRYQLERVYGIARPARFMRAPGERITAFPQFEVVPVPQDSEPEILLEPSGMPRTISEDELTVPVQAATPAPAPSVEPEPVPEAELEAELAIALEPEPEPERPSQVMHAARPLADLDDLPADVAIDAAVPRAVEEDNSSGRERRTYVRTIGDTRSPEAALARISIRRVAVTPPSGVHEPTTTGKTVGEATRAIRRATDRDRVAELSMDALFRFAPSCHAATLLVLRGQIATSWKGFCRSGAPHPELAVPLDQPGLVPRVANRNQTARAPSSDLGPIDQLLMASLGHSTGELIAVPISIGGEVMCVIAMVTEADSASTTAESIAAAAGAAFARLMRDASR
ncbi:MAG: ral secretory system protein domain protein [Myxococcales bacterium]|nr:ral secretory system protein domain protein [Myxococcales bacterium]